MPIVTAVPLTETPLPTETPVPTEVPTEIPPPPTPVVREVVLYPAADTSVTATAPDAAQAPEQLANLVAGGPDGAVTYLTFNVAGVAPGTLLDARLVLTGSGEVAAGGGAVSVLPGQPIDEWALTYTGTAAFLPVPALTIDGSPVLIPGQDPGVEIWLDVSGTVTADSTITFAITGPADATLTFASRESATPPRLVLTVQDSVPVALAPKR